MAYVPIPWPSVYYGPKGDVQVVSSVEMAATLPPVYATVPPAPPADILVQQATVALSLATATVTLVLPTFTPTEPDDSTAPILVLVTPPSVTPPFL